MAPTAADVPTKFDCLINGQGYVYYDPWTVGSSSNAPEKAVYTYTPNFIERQNTQGDYGDNQQDFWLTFSQRDWSLGEGQRYQGRTDDARRKYWQGSAADISSPGKVTLRGATGTFSPAASITAASSRGSSNSGNGSTIAFTTSTNLYELLSDGTITDDGAHGYGTSPSTMVSDGVDLYMSKGASGVGVRKWDGSTFSTFSDATTTGQRVDFLAFLNNTLYGLKNSTDTLYSFSTGGVATSVFTWKQADGGAGGGSCLGLAPYGGKLLILRSWGQEGLTALSIYDGVGVSLLTAFPGNFFGSCMSVVNGVVFVGGSVIKATSNSNFVGRPTIYYYANGTIGVAWQGDGYGSTGGTWSSLGSIDGAVQTDVFDSCLVFTDDYRGAFLSYDIGSGAVSTLFTYSVPNSFTPFSAGNSFLAREDETSTYYPNLATKASTATVTSSLIDFDSSLNKIFRGVKVEFDSATDGNGGSVDISYRVGDVDGSYTSLQTGAVSGTEYTLSGVTGRSISIKITLNKGTSTLGPVLKRMYVRGVPVPQAFRLEQYVLNCTGRSESGVNDPHYLELRDGTVHNLDGLQMATNLRTAYTAGTTISITDKFGTFTGVVEQLKLTEIRPNEFVSEVTVREV